MHGPKGGQGDVLITCRSGLLAESLVPSPIEITSFSVSESTGLLLKILNKCDASLEEVNAAKALSEKLGGLPLAIDVIGKNIRAARKFKTIADFLPFYEKNQHALRKRSERGMRDVTYSKDLATVWETAFESLNYEVNNNANPDTVKLMLLLCLVGPGAIPQWLFQVPISVYPEEWKFLNNNTR